MSANDYDNAPMPKINVPPISARSVSVGAATRLQWSIPKRGDQEPERPAAGREETAAKDPAAIRWDLRFVLSLIVLTILVNITLALALRNNGDGGRVFVTSADREPLSELSPAAGTPETVSEGTTTYISDDDRKALLEHLQRLRQPSLVPAPATRESDN